MLAVELASDIAKLAGQSLIDASALKAVNNYLGSGSSSVPVDTSPQIPVKRKGLSGSKQIKTSPKIEKKDALSKYSDAVNAGLAAVAGLAIAGVSSMSDSVKTDTETKQAENDAHKANFPLPSLPQNQILMKESIDEIVNAINANTIASVTFLSPISSNLAAISSTLIAISSTLLEISDNYAQEIQSADDLPYIDSDTFYDLLEKGGIDAILLKQYRQGEKDLVKRLMDSGASYSDIKQAINDYRKTAIPKDLLLETEAKSAGITSPKPVDSNGTPTPSNASTIPKTIDYTPHLEKMAAAADSAKAVTDFVQTPREFSDSDGDLLHSGSPMEIEAAKNAQSHKHLDDRNTERHDENDFNMPDTLPIIPFIGRSSVLNPNGDISSNSFFDLLKQKYSSLFS